MANILNRSVLVVVITLSVAVALAGCSAVSGNPDPQKIANEKLTKASKSVAEHNKLFEQSRDTYSVVKKELEAGNDPSKQADRIAEAKNTLEKAHGDLEDARKSLQGVQNLDVDPAVKDYARLLSGAMGTQLDAESKEVEFYGIMQKDPTLGDNRDRALNLLSEVGKGYKKADDAYEKAQKFADSHPRVISAPPSDEKTGPKTTPSVLDKQKGETTA